MTCFKFFCHYSISNHWIDLRV